MRFTTTLLTTLVASATAIEYGAPSEQLIPRDALPEAEPELELEERSGGRPACPSVWTSITTTLTKDFYDSTAGQCTDRARAAIRAAFHDAGAWDKTQTYISVDGSLCLSSDENARGENTGLQDICTYYKGVKAAASAPISMADLIQFGGAAAVVLCPGGQPYTLLVGRSDSSAANAPGFLPSVTADGPSLYTLFQNKGFDAVDLAALLGAHTCSKQFAVDTTQAGKPQDSTPGLWDVKYYSETLNPSGNPGDFVFQSDVNLAAHPVVGKEFQGFVNNQGKWTGKFGSAMNRMSLLGISDSSKMADCTNALPSAKSKRDLTRALLGAKAV